MLARGRPFRARRRRYVRVCYLTRSRGEVYSGGVSLLYTVRLYVLVNCMVKLRSSLWSVTVALSWANKPRYVLYTIDRDD